MTHPAAGRSDLVVLVADADMKFALAALLQRRHALGIRRTTFDIFKHDDRDAGCFARAQDYLRPLAGDYDHALVMFDRHGCGSSQPAPDIEAEVRDRLERAGWRDLSAAVVLDPELEMWVWSPSPKVAECLGWPPDGPALRRWLEQQGLWQPNSPKPTDPKAAVERVRREVKKRRSPRLYEQLASAVTTRHCVDDSFGRFREVLQRWFPAGQQAGGARD